MTQLQIRDTYDDSAEYTSRIRKATGLSQSEFAAHAKLTVRQVQSYEIDERAPGYDAMRKYQIMESWRK